MILRSVSVKFKVCVTRRVTEHMCLLFTALESQDPDAAKDEAPDFYPQTKQTIQMLLRDLLTVRRIAALN